MSDPMENTADIEQAAVTAIRENVREDVRNARIKHRHNQIDRLRILPADVDTLSINLMSFTKDDIITIARNIKKRKHITPVELQKLSRAFLQSSDNIECFLTITGALNVLVKEFIGSDTEKQALAVECFCNLSLGSPMSCEIVALKAGSYFHTFLTSSNEWLVRTTVWCLTNLIVVGGKSLNILLTQEIIKGLIHIGEGKCGEETKNEAFFAIEKILDQADKPSLKETDADALCAWILAQTLPLSHEITFIAYKLLNVLDFQASDPDVLRKLFVNSFTSLLHYVDSSAVTSPTNRIVHQCIILLRICSNIVVRQNEYADFLIGTWFCASSPIRSISLFFNAFSDLIKSFGMSSQEICWFIGNLMNCSLNEANMAYLEGDGMFSKLNIDVI